MAALFVGLAVPSGWKMYRSMEYRKAVRDISTAASAARYNAITSGIAQDVLVDTAASSYLVREHGKSVRRDSFHSLPESISLAARTAAEINPTREIAGIRFYPDGSSSGGSISVSRETSGGADGVRLRVDWLLGRVTQEPL